MYKAFLIKYGEIGIKGKNRYVFEDTLVSRTRNALQHVDGEFSVRKENGRIYAEAHSAYDFDEVTEALGRVFGIVGVCPVVLTEDEGTRDAVVIRRDRQPGGRLYGGKARRKN